jgi:hypothetical protein
MPSNERESSTSTETDNIVVIHMLYVTRGTPRIWDSGNLNRITQITFLCVTTRNII